MTGAWSLVSAMQSALSNTMAMMAGVSFMRFIILLRRAKRLLEGEVFVNRILDMGGNVSESKIPNGLSKQGACCAFNFINCESIAAVCDVCLTAVTSQIKNPFINSNTCYNHELIRCFVSVTAPSHLAVRCNRLTRRCCLPANNPIPA